MASFGIDVGWCGFGFDGGLLRGVRLGVVRIWCCRGTIGAQIVYLHDALTKATRMLRGDQP